MSSTTSSTQRNTSTEINESASGGLLRYEEKAVLQRQLDIPPPKPSFLNLFRYATRSDKAILLAAVACSIAAGAVNPVMTLVFGKLATYFQEFLAGTTDAKAFSNQLSRFTLYYVYLGIGQFFLTYISIVGHTYVGEHITARVREEYLAAILRQNIAFFDTLGSGEITNHMTADTTIILDGISSKVGNAITAVFTLVAAYIVAFTQSWKLTLILTSTVVCVTLSIMICSAFVVHCAERSLAPTAAAGTITEEAFSSIRNITAFNAQNAILQNYQQYMVKAEKWALKSKIAVATSIGVITGVVCFNYGLAFWMGARYLIDGQLELGNILTTVMSIMIGATYLGLIGASIHAMSAAVAATSHIFSVIDRQSPIDPSSNQGIELSDPQGFIELRSIKMAYPSRPDAVITKDLNLTFPKGKTTALVGASGSGKSTIIGLIERFYNPASGQVLFDGVDVQDLNLRWLRQQMALVQQEPTVFNTTVAANIAQGLVGSRYEHVPAEDKKNMIEAAAKMSNAHDFIVALPYGYETMVGQQGTLLSGGQKQRIAIARAIIGDPKVLLLDEATSALDTKSERIVQAALDKAAKGRTTILIAHRLSTVKMADNIIVMSGGEAIEQGTHDGLIARRGAYYDLVHAQRLDEQVRGEEPETSGELEVIDQHILSKESDSIHDTTEKNDLVKIESSSDLEINDHPKKNYSLWTLIKFTAAFNKQESFIMLLGLIASILAGGGTPVQAILFAKAIVSLSRPPSQYGTLQHNVNFWSLMFLVLGIEQFLAYVGQGVAFAVCSERLLQRTKSQALRSILRQEIAFFDKDKNGPGALSTFLSAEVGGLAGLSGVALGTILTATTTLVASIVLSCTFYWKLGLVCTSTVPILLGCGFLRIWLLARYQQKTNISYQAAATYACEALAAIRTVASLTREDDVSSEYHRQMIQQRKENLSRILKSGFLYAISQAAVLFVTALAFWYGGTLIAASEIGLYQFFLCFSAIVFGAQMAGAVFAFAPEIANAKAAAQSLKAQLDTRPSIDSWSKEGEKVEKVRGEVEFKDVCFSYPSRPNENVLSGISFKAEPGSYVALVGASGCGKSTTVALLESFYSPTSGHILLDGKDISDLNLLEYRKHFALVIQEPSLYQGTIRENILLGVTDGTVSDVQIEHACKSANIYDFIMSLPDGYDTVVGSRGSMLSGGQKQRIAIARALLRDPAVLLLDEATSALDSQSEEVVQAALDAASAGRTTIAIAHRLSTIQKADVINVFDKGKIVESGTHSELLVQRGLYFNLVESQRLQNGS
ncbi:P-loop containing nucleoside triphosphate hydrolase protein [Xylogone sp. PMI_703]|nr:P-loop containing nucleoside triphosphate hydrolase protein [Xylogone sp. PMI_703]